MERAIMAAYFKTLAQAEKHVHEKKHTRSGKLQWRIVDCTIGYLVLSEAHAKQCFPALFYGSQQSLRPPTKAPERYDIERV
jgi:hypothetical protein